MPEHVEVHTPPAPGMVFTDEMMYIGWALVSFVLLITFAKKFVAAWEWFCAQVNKDQSIEIDAKVKVAEENLDGKCSRRVSDMTQHLEQMLEPAIKKIDTMSEDITQLRIDHSDMKGEIGKVSTDLNNLKGYVEAVDSKSKDNQQRINEMERQR